MGLYRYFDKNSKDFWKTYKGMATKKQLLDNIWESMKAGRYNLIINTKTKKKTLQVW